MYIVTLESTFSVSLVLSDFFYTFILIRDKFLYPVSQAVPTALYKTVFANMEWTDFSSLTISNVEAALYSTKVYGCLAGQSLTVKYYNLSEKIILKCK